MRASLSSLSLCVIALACYKAGLAQDPTLFGRVVVDFVISGSGRVVSATVASDTLAQPAVSACTAIAVKRWKFPNPRGGGDVVVSYPFDFTAS